MTELKGLEAWLPRKKMRMDDDIVFYDDQFFFGQPKDWITASTRFDEVELTKWQKLKKWLVGSND